MKQQEEQILRFEPSVLYNSGQIQQAEEHAEFGPVQKGEFPKTDNPIQRVHILRTPQTFAQESGPAPQN